MRLTSLIAIGLVTVACSPEKETPAAAAAPVALTAAQLDSVRAVDAAFAAGINAKDTAAVFATYAADANVLPPDSPILHGAEGHPAIAGLVAGGASDMVLHTTTAYGVGDLAYMVGTATFTMGGAAQTVKYGEVVRRGTDGKWRYVMDMFSGVTPPPAVAKK